MSIYDNIGILQNHGIRSKAKLDEIVENLCGMRQFGMR